MTLDDKRLTHLVKACAGLVATYSEETKEELSDDFVLLWNTAIKIVTPLEFCKMICDELENEKK